MDAMDGGGDVNGGNNEMAQDNNDSAVSLMNLTGLNNQETNEDKKQDDETLDELNGDVKKLPTSMAKRRSRKFKTSSTSTNESDHETGRSTRNLKRKLSDVQQLASDDSQDFFGFERIFSEPAKNTLEIIEKLIAEAELIDTPVAKRIKRSLPKVPRKNVELKAASVEDQLPQPQEQQEDDEGEDVQEEEEGGGEEDEEVDVTQQQLQDKMNILDPNDIKVRSDTSINPISDENKSEVDSDLDDKSTSPVTNKIKNTNNSVKQKTAMEVDNPLFKLPFKFGWKRELIIKADKIIDVSYYTPKGKKVKNFKEIGENLKDCDELKSKNFTFIKELTGINNPELEIMKEDTSNPPVKRMVKRLSITKKVGGKLVSTSPSNKTPGKWSPVKATPPTVKTKLINRRTPFKKAVTPPKEQEAPSPWSNSPSAVKRTPVLEKNSAYKAKRTVKTKVQEPCSIRCALSMGLIPSVKCRLCLCLYHPECVGVKNDSNYEDYICKNCQPVASDVKKSVAPPPLIPISMINSQNMTSKLPNKDEIICQKSKVDETEKFSSSLETANVSSKLTEREKWYPRMEKNYLLGQDNPELKPAQNIAVLGGKRYIVVPKDNAMSVQPAITAKPKKSINKVPSIEENHLLPSEFKDPGPIDSEIKEKENIEETAPPSDDNNQQPESNCNDAPEITVPDKPHLVSEEVSDKVDPIPEESNKVTDSASLLSLIEQQVANDHMIYTEMSMEAVEVLDSSHVETVEKTNEMISTPVPMTLQVDNEIKKSAAVQIDQREYIMATVCAGYNALSRVFQYLTVQELLRAARVCKMWRDLASQPLLWKTVRMKNSQVTDWDGLANSLIRHESQHLDLRKMVGETNENIWNKFVPAISRVKSLTKLVLCRCPVNVLEDVITNFQQLEVFSATSIANNGNSSVNLENLNNLKRLKDLRLKASTPISINNDLIPLKDLIQLTYLSLTSMKELGLKKLEVLSNLINLESLELGECSDLQANFGTTVLINLTKLERLRLEKGQGNCCTFDILTGVSQMENLQQLELVNFDVKNGFDKRLAECKNIKRLLIIPTYISQSATSNNMVLGGVTELSNSLTLFIWGVTSELLRVTELFIDQCHQINQQGFGESIPVLKPVPSLNLIEDQSNVVKSEETQTNPNSPQVDILPLPKLQKLLLTALPKTRVKILKIPFHATWRQSISDNSASTSTSTSVSTTTSTTTTTTTTPPTTSSSSSAS